MKILLIQPRCLSRERILEPLNLGYLASLLKSKGYQDTGICSAAFDSDKKIIALASKADIVGVSVLSPSVTHANMLAMEIKKINSKVITVWGGWHPSALPGPTLKNKDIDFVVRGEGEITFYELVEAINGNKKIEEVSGVSYRKNGNVTHNQPRKIIDDIDTLPYPDRDLMRQNDFIKRYDWQWGVRKASILSSRGCYFSCQCCASSTIWGRLWRCRSTENVIDEIKNLINKYDIARIDFVDPVFTAKKDRVFEFYRLLIKERIRIHWSCWVHAATVDKDVLTAMKSAGCEEIWVGVESASSIILKGLQKGINIQKVKEVFQIAKDISLRAIAYFMIGFPNDNLTTIKESEVLIDEIKPSNAPFYILTPMPGCDYYHSAKEKGYVNDDFDWSSVDWDKATMPTKYLSREDLNKEYQRLNKKFSYLDLDKKKKFRFPYLIYRGITELNNTSISGLNFLWFKFWHYLKLSVFYKRNQ